MRRILSFLLSVAMLISMFPAGAFATELETAPVAEPQAVTEAATEQATEAAETAAAETLAETAAAETTEETETPETAVETEAAETAAETVPETTEAVVEETLLAEEAAATAEDAFRAALADAAANGTGLTVWDEITLTSDLTVDLPGELSFADHSKLVVSSGVTLTLNCPTIINGATLIVEEGGKLISNVNLTVVAPMNPATFDMNGAFVNNGMVWVNEGATVNINGTAVSYYQPIHVGFGGNGKTSTLNINGTMTSYGYLNIADAGAPGVLNVAGKLILEKDENGNAYLQAANPVNVAGILDNRAAVTVGNDAGTAVLTIAQGGQVIVAENSMWFDIAGGGALVNNGTLVNNFYQICNYGTLTNNGTLNNPAKIRNYGTYTNNGSVSGNAPVDGVADARNMFLDGIAYAAANGEDLTVWDEVILDEDLVIDMEGILCFADYAKLVVPNGVTLTLNTAAYFNDAQLVVQEGGKLVSNMSLTFNAPNLGIGGAVIDGNFTNNGMLWVNEGATVNINGTAVSDCAAIHVGFGGNGKTSTLNINGTLSTNDYLNIADAGAKGLLNVNRGATLNILNDENGCGYLDNTSQVKIDGTLNVDGLFTTGAGKDDNGNVVGRDASATINGTVNGGKNSTIGVGAHGSVNIFGNMNTAGEVVVEKDSALWVDGSVIMNGPVNAAGWFHVGAIKEFGTQGVLHLNNTADITGYLAVHEGGALYAGADSVLNILNNEMGFGYLDNQGSVTLNGKMNLDGLFTTGAAQDDDGNIMGGDAFATINGTVNGGENSLIGVGVGGTLTNDGTVNTKGELTIDGIWKGTPAVTAPTQEVGTMTQDEFIAALVAADGYYPLEDSVYIYSDMVISGFVIVEEAGELYICDGVTLTLDGIVQVNGGKMEIRDGGAVVANVINTGVGVINDGTLTIKNGGTLDVSVGTMGVDGGHVIAEAGASVIGDTIEFNPLEGSVTGIPGSQMTAVGSAGDQVQLEQILNAAANYQRARVYVFEPFVLSGAVTVPAGTTMEVGAQDLEVVSGGKITVCGEAVVSGNIYVAEGGSVSVADGGKITVKTLMQAGGGDVTVEDGGSIEVALNEDYGGGFGVFDGGSLTVKAGGYLNTGNGELGVDGGTLTAEPGSIVLGDGFSMNYFGSTITGISTERIALNGPVTQQSELTEILHFAENYKRVGIFVEYDAQLSGKVNIPANTKIYFTSGANTIASGAVVTVDGTMVVFEEAAVTNNGAVWLASEESLEVMGTWSGNPAQVGQPEETMSFEEFKDALDRDYVDLREKVVIEESMEVNNLLYVYDGGEIVVPDGVTLTVNGNVIMYGGSLTVEAGGTLVNRGSIYVSSGSVMTVEGSYSASSFGELNMSYGEATVNGVDKSLISLSAHVYSEEELRDVAAQTDYNELAVSVWDAIKLSQDLQLTKTTLWLHEQMTIPSGVTLQLEKSCVEIYHTITLENGAILRCDDDSNISLLSGAMIAESNAVLSIPRGGIKVYFDEEDAEIIGVAPELICAIYEPESVEALMQSIEEGAEYGRVEIDLMNGTTLTEDLTIPENTILNIYSEEGLTIPSGITLINQGEIYIGYDAYMWVQEGATLNNQGSIDGEYGDDLIVDGTLIDNTQGGGGGNYGGVTTFEELKAAAEAGEEWIEIYDSITLTENLTIPSACYVEIYEDGEIIVPDGMTLTMLGSMSIYTGKLTVLAGGTAQVTSLYVNGTVAVDPNGSFTVLQDGGMMVRYGCQITGIPKSSYGVEYMAYSEADIRTGLKIVGHNWVSVRLYEDVTLKSNLTIPQYTSLIIESLWQDGEDVPVTLTVPSGKTITNNGSLATTEPEGCLIIEKGGKVINNAVIYNHAILENQGEIVNNGEMYLYGTMTGDGKITGDGYMDYARPVYSHEDLVNWLSEDIVPTYLYVWDEVTLEDHITIPEGVQLIMEGSTLIVPDGVTLTMNGELWAQYGGTVIFESGSKLINNGTVIATESGVITFQVGSKIINCYSIDAFPSGTLNVYGTYVRENEDANLALYGGGTINGVANNMIHYAANFSDEASLQAILDETEAQGYGQLTARLQFGCGVAEINGSITIPENAYLFVGKYYADTLVLNPGAVLTNYGEIIVEAPGTMIVESGAELINHGKIDADEGCLIYRGGDITIAADATSLYGKGKLNLTATVTPASSAKITWTLAEGDEIFATLKGSGTKATLTAADVTGKHTVTVIASALLANGAEVSDAMEITIVPLTQKITLLSGGMDVTGQTIIHDLASQDVTLTMDLAAVVAPGDANASLEWTSSNEAIATVEDGKVSFTAREGKVTITASATDGSKASAKVTIDARYLIQALELLEGASELVGGKGTQLKVIDTQAPAKELGRGDVIWTLASESDAAYVSVTADGKVTTKAVPERISVKLLCSVANNPKATALEHTITIYPAVTQVDLIDGDEIYTGRTIKLSRGDMIILQPSQYPLDSMAGVEWSPITEKDKKFVEVVKLPTEDAPALILKSTGEKGTVTVKITAADGSKKSASVKLQTGTYVEKVEVTSPVIDLVSGEKVQLTATPYPADADNKAVVWSLEDPNDKQYVSVSASGLVSAKKGLLMSKSVTVVATAKDGSGAYGDFTFQLKPADPGALVIMQDAYTNVTGATINVDLLTGGSIKLKAKYFNTDSADVTWSGKNVTFSAADADGYVTATVSGKGTFTVTADDGNGKKATVKLKAANLSEMIQISGPTAVASGKSIQLTATVLPEGKVADKKVTWWIDPVHTQYATISSSGKLTAAKNLTSARNISVWAQAKDGNSEPEMYLVDILPLAQSVQILESGIDVTNTTYVWDLAVDEGKPAITAEVLAADASQDVVWKLSGAKVLQLNADGTFSVTGKTGTATVTATAADGSNKKASFKFTVVKSMEYIRQSLTETVIAGGKSLKMASFVTVDSQASNQKLTWSMTGDTEVATLSATGVLKTKKVTDCKTITVTAMAADGSGCQAEFTVYVYPATTSVKLLCDGEAAPKQATLGIGETLTLEGISLPSTAAQGPGAYTWKLSSDKFAEIQENPDGTVTVTGKAAGTVTVTCTAADGSGKKATLKIKVG